MGRCLSFDDGLVKRFCVNDCLTISFTINRKQAFKSLVKSKSLVFSPAVPNFDKYVNPPFSQEYWNRFATSYYEILKMCDCNLKVYDFFNEKYNQNLMFHFMKTLLVITFKMNFHWILKFLSTMILQTLIKITITITCC